MGDISEMRGIITVIAFLACFILLIGLIPAQFLVADYEGRDVHVPEEFDSIDLESYATTWSHTMNETGEGGYARIPDIDLAGHVCALWYKQANATPLHIRWVHQIYEWIFFPAFHPMEWLFNGIHRGDSDHWLYASELDADYVTGDPIEYTVMCSHFTAHVFFGFNETLYDSPTEAWNGGGLNILVGLEFDQVSTSLNAWSLISMLLFFQLPEVNWVINALLNAPIWACIAYLSFILILRAIGAVFGGGGA